MENRINEGKIKKPQFLCARRIRVEESVSVDRSRRVLAGSCIGRAHWPENWGLDRGLALGLRSWAHVEAQNLLLVAVRTLRSSMVAGDAPFATRFTAQRIGLVGLSRGWFTPRSSPPGPQPLGNATADSAGDDGGLGRLSARWARLGARDRVGTG